MTRVAWATDLHLNHAIPQKLEDFRLELQRCRPDILVVSGDFSESLELFASIEWLRSSSNVPLYFCLGNHDFYYDSISRVRSSCTQFCEGQRDLIYLTAAGPRELDEDVGILGHDGWADGRSPNYETSLVTMHDSRLIEEFSSLNKKERWDVMKTLADESSHWLENHLPAALEQWPLVFLVTHAPPFRQACWYNGQISDDHWAPHFVNRVLGETLLQIMSRYTKQRVIVLCGHTHGEGMTHPLPNLTVYTGRAMYGTPCLAKTFDLATLR
jgi:Icc protein